MKTLPLSNENGIVERFHVSDDEYVIERVQDVSPFLKQNKIEQGFEVNKKASMRKAASIPPVVWENWMKEFKAQRGYDYSSAKARDKQDFIKLKLNDPDNEFLRIWKGRL